MAKSVFVSGANGGLGQAVVKECVARGFQVYATDIVCGPAFAALLEQNKETVRFFSADVTKNSEVDALGDWIEAQTPALDLMLNTLGIYTFNSTLQLEELDIDQSLRMFDINALGPLRLVKRLMPLLVKGGDKVLVNVSSEAASMAASERMTSRYDYGMSKAALNLQTTVLQRQYGKQGVKCILVHPGWLRTDMGRFSGGAPDVEPEDSAKGILNLAQRYRGRVDDWMYFDYNGTRRPW